MFARSRTTVIALAVILLCFLYWQLRYEPLDFRSSSAFSRFRPSSHARCSPDPYRQNGYLSIPRDNTSYKDTVYIPFNDKLFAHIVDEGNEGYDVSVSVETVRPSASETAESSVDLTRLTRRGRKQSRTPSKASDADGQVFEYFSDDRPSTSDLASAGAPPNLMKYLQQYVSSPSNSSLEDFSWLRNRHVLIFGDSIDRFMVSYFCEELFAVQHGEKHKTASCHIPSLNFTLHHWHVASMYTSRPSFWWLPTMDNVTFESRWDEFYRPQYAKLRPDGQPDFILFNSGLWDMRVFQEVGRNHPDVSLHGTLGTSARQLTLSESRFFVGRTRAFIARIRSEFPAAPLMYRTLSHIRPGHKYSGHDAMLRDLDRLNRFVVKEEGIEVFEWARIVEYLADLYLDYLHLGKGPASWLWANMLLGYMRRELVEGGWGRCHEEELGWAGGTL